MKKSAFTYKGPLIWNNLPAFMKKCITLDDFKLKCKCYFIDVQY